MSVRRVPFLRTWGEQRFIRLGAVVLCLIILVVTACSYWNIRRLQKQESWETARLRALTAIEKDRVLRAWVSEQAGVYVTASPLISPDPYLEPDQREVSTTDGRRLIRLSPGSLTRLLHDKGRTQSGLRAHLTSLRPLRPENKADAWETGALVALAQSHAPSFSEVTELDGEQVVRVMTPVIMRESCLACHSAQGYRPGEVGGGISAAFAPGGPDDEGGSFALWGGLGAHLLLALLGVAGVGGISRGLLRYCREREAATEALRGLTEAQERRVSERTRQLEESENRSRRILSSTTDGLIGVNGNGDITFINEAALLMLGYGAESELIDKPLHETVHCQNPDGSRHENAVCPLCEARRKAFRVKFRDEIFLRKDGSLVMISGSMAPMLEEGRVVGSIVAFQDVSELHEMEVLQQAIFENSSEPFFFWNEKRALVQCNAAAVAILGAGSMRDVVDHLVDFTPEHQEDGCPSLEKAAQTFDLCDRERVVRLTWTLRHASGEPIPCEVSMVRITYRHFTGYFGALHDLRAAREYERRLENERKLLHDIIQACPAAMFIHDDDLRIRLSNKAARRLSGLQDEDFLTSAWVRSDEREAVERQARAGASVEALPMQVYGRAGEKLDTLATVTGVWFDDKPALLVWLQNVTDLVAARREAEASVKAKSDFLAHMSHEIRTPMNAIMGMTYLLLQTAMDDAQRHYAERAQKAARNLLGLLNDVLDFSKIEAGRMTLEAAPFLLADALKNVSDLLAFAAEDKGLELLFAVDPDVPDTLVGDALRLSQVLINLTSNALKFTEAGQVTVRIHLLEKSETLVSLQCEVADSGIGLSQEQIARLFQPFRQGDDSTTRKYGGSGLGLSICDQLVRLMGGTIWVRSEPGAGSCFGFTAEFRPAPPAAELGAPECGHFNGERVLVVDDNAMARDILADMARDLGCRVGTASSGAEAVKAVADAVEKRNPYRLVLLDWKMPDMDGFECVARLRECLAPPLLPGLIMVSAFGQEEYQRHGRDGVLRDYLAKPVNRLDLWRSMFGALNGQAFEPLVEGRGPACDEALAAFRGACVLLVEDDEINREVATGMLRNFGLEVQEASNGVEAVEACRQKAFDLVLMDVQMPVMDGREATRRIRAMNGASVYELPIVAMTAYAMTTDRDISLQAGMNDHITKPIMPDVLAGTLQRWLRPRRSSETAVQTDPAEKDGPSEPVLPSFLPGIDVENALRRENGNISSFIRHLRMFADRYQAWPERMREALTSGQAKEAAAMAHTLMGAAGTVGAMEVSACAAILKKQGDDTEVSRATVARLREALSTVCLGVAAAFSGAAGQGLDTTGQNGAASSSEEG